MKVRVKKSFDKWGITKFTIEIKKSWLKKWEIYYPEFEEKDVMVLLHKFFKQLIKNNGVIKIIKI